MLVFTDEDGKTYRVTADAAHQDVNAYYGLPMAHCEYEDLGGGAYFIHFLWDSNEFRAIWPRPRANRWRSTS